MRSIANLCEGFVKITPIEYQLEMRIIEREIFPIEYFIKRFGIELLSILAGVYAVNICYKKACSTILNVEDYYTKYITEEIDGLDQCVGMMPFAYQEIYRMARNTFVGPTWKDVDTALLRKSKKIDIDDPWFFVTALARCIQQSEDVDIQSKWFYFRVFTLLTFADVVHGQLDDEDLLIHLTERGSYFFALMRDNLETAINDRN